jgi:hypothetical protein
MLTDVASLSTVTRMLTPACHVQPALDLELARVSATYLLIVALAKAGYTCRKNVTNVATEFLLQRSDVPDWCPSIIIEESGTKNYMRYAQFRTSDMSVSGVGKVLKKLTQDCIAAKEILVSQNKKETQARQYRLQKHAELSGLPETEFMDITINGSGKHAGKYSVRFELGSVLERLTRQQVWQLTALICKFEEANT